MDGSAYATEGYGFLCLPRVITQRLVEMNYKFEPADAWLDLWCHTVFQEPDNVFSVIAPVIQYGNYGAVMTLEKLGQRWGWEKTKVWRFMNKYRDTFSLHRLPGAYGCLIFNRLYPAGKDSQIDYENIQEKITHILKNIRILSQNTYYKGTDHERLNHWIAWFSYEMDTPVVSAEQGKMRSNGFRRVALFRPIIRAYFSQCRNCKMYIYACGKKIYSILFRFRYIRGPCILRMVYIMQKVKEIIT